MRYVSLAIAFLAVVLASCGKAPPADMAATMVERAARVESEVRVEYRNATGHDAQNDRELLRYIDQRVQSLGQLDEQTVDALVQAYGATLGQVLIRELGGRWVRAEVDGEPQDGVSLPDGKIAFVFNRAYQRIAEKDSVGFEAFYDSALAIAKGEPLPAGLVNKRSSDGVQQTVGADRDP